jgi:hypothetical protein
MFSSIILKNVFQEATAPYMNAGQMLRQRAESVTEEIQRTGTCAPGGGNALRRRSHKEKENAE